MAILSSLPMLTSALELDNLTSILLVDASTLDKRHTPPFSPEADTLILGIDSTDRISDLKMMLGTVYPPSHEVKWIQACGTKKQVVVYVQLSDLGTGESFLGESAVLIPPLPRGSSFEQFQEVIAHLRAPDGCPWDREQTHHSLRKHLIEESYEALDALDSGFPVEMREEFGDLLLQIVLNAQIASELGEFTMTDVIRGIHDKIVRRHPHVFGNVVAENVGNVLQNWEKIKADERDAKGDEDSGLLDGLPGSLPALIQAQEIQSRAARVGFDWPEIEGVLEKISEEAQEVRNASNNDELASEIGDLLFALVNLARWKEIDAESALRGTNRKFKQRFSYIENEAKEMRKRLQDLTLDEMETMWQASKNELN